MRNLHSAIFLTLLSASFLAHATDYPLTGTFTDLKCIESEGDVIGTEITILGGFNEAQYSYYALIQFAEGVATKPQLIPITINDGAFKLKAKYLEAFDVEISA